MAEMTHYNKNTTDQREFHIEHFGGGRGGGGHRGGGGRGHHGGGHRSHHHHHGHGGRVRGGGDIWYDTGNAWRYGYGPYYNPYYVGQLANPYYYYNNIGPSTQQCVEVGKYDTCNDPYRPVKISLDTHGTGRADEWRCCTKYA